MWGVGTCFSPPLFLISRYLKFFYFAMSNIHLFNFIWIPSIYGIVESNKIDLDGSIKLRSKFNREVPMIIFLFKSHSREDVQVHSPLTRLRLPPVWYQCGCFEFRPIVGSKTCSGLVQSFQCKFWDIYYKCHDRNIVTPTFTQV